MCTLWKAGKDNGLLWKGILIGQGCEREIMEKLYMPRGARYIIRELEKNGFEAYIVGGCVRDSILNKTPSDWDITTRATPVQIKKIFKRTVDTGIQHGTVTVLVDKSVVRDEAVYAFEVTTYRVDGEYKDHRRPSSVTFTPSLEEDLQRRDFTINAMAYNDTHGIVDIFGGREDLKKGIIRCVGIPAERFDEDALRILRAVRFAAQLGFQIDAATKAAMAKQAGFLRDISMERIQVELTKLIMSDNPGLLVTAYELGLTGVFLPEFDTMMETPQNNPHHIYSVGIHTIKVMENVLPDKIMRYAALLHDVAKPLTRVTDTEGVDHFYGHQEKGTQMAEDILRRLKMDNDTIRAVCRLVYNHDFGLCQVTEKPLFRRFLAGLGREHFSEYIALRRADMAGQSEYRQQDKEKSIAGLIELYNEVIDRQECISISELAIGGRDLIQMGMKPGKEIGDILKTLLELVLENPEINKKDTLTDIVRERFGL